MVALDGCLELVELVEDGLGVEDTLSFVEVGLVLDELLAVEVDQLADPLLDALDVLLLCGAVLVVVAEVEHVGLVELRVEDGHGGLGVC